MRFTTFRRGLLGVERTVVEDTDPRLHRAHLLKEGLRLVFQLDPDGAGHALQAWIGWARRCRIPAFVDLQRKIVKHTRSG